MICPVTNCVPLISKILYCNSIHQITINSFRGFFFAWAPFILFNLIFYNFYFPFLQHIVNMVCPGEVLDRVCEEAESAGPRSIESISMPEVPALLKESSGSKLAVEGHVLVAHELVPLSDREFWNEDSSHLHIFASRQSTSTGDSPPDLHALSFVQVNRVEPGVHLKVTHSGDSDSLLHAHFIKSLRESREQIVAEMKAQGGSRWPPPTLYVSTIFPLRQDRVAFIRRALALGFTEPPLGPLTDNTRLMLFRMVLPLDFLNSE